jgi:hypothetical protein
MKKYEHSFVIGEDDDEPQAVSMPNPPPEIAAQLVSDKPLHRPNRPRDQDPKKESPAS